MPIFWSLDLERMLIYQKKFLWKSAILHSIKLPFDVQAAEKNLTCYLFFNHQYNNLYHHIPRPQLLLICINYDFLGSLPRGGASTQCNVWWGQNLEIQAPTPHHRRPGCIQTLPSSGWGRLLPVCPSVYR